MNCTYYECSNTDCKFRFPSNEQLSGNLACPVCRSLVTIAASFEIQSERASNRERFTHIPIEALFDNIRSALNVGSMFRTADGFGIRRLYLCGITPTPELRNVAKSSLGAEKYVRWTYEKNSLERIHKLKDQNYLIVAVEEHQSAENIFKVAQQSFNQPLVLVVGNEICGVDPGILDVSDLILKIPMSGIKKSLNVAVAFGIAASMLQFSFINQEDAEIKE